MEDSDQPGLADRLEMAAARAIAALPPAAKRRIAGRPIRRDGLELDLDMQVLLKLEERNPRPSLSTRTPSDAREDLRHAVRVVAGAPVALASIRETTVSGAAGPLPARLYVPDDSEAAAQGPLVVYYHGGGWVAGDIDTHDQPCRLLAKTSGARVLSVGYRLSPEHRFPAPVDDALAAFRDAVARSDELGADPARVAVAGDSAGGHLAAVTARQSVGEDGPAPAFQLLIYPVTDCVQVAASRVTFAEGFILTKPDMDWYEQQFFGADGAPGARRDGRLRSSARRGRGVCATAARGRSADAAETPSPLRTRLHPRAHRRARSARSDRRDGRGAARGSCPLRLVLSGCIARQETRRVPCTLWALVPS